MERIEFSDWKPIAEVKFHYTPPASAALYTPPKLLANGTLAPDFTANDKDGKPVKLSDYNGKIAILDFWATWCGLCQESLPHTTDIARNYAKDGLVVLALNTSDTPEAFQNWLPEYPQYGARYFVIDQKGIAAGLYNVVAIPTQYLIGKDGKIVTGIIGYDEESFRLEDALKASGVEQIVYTVGVSGKHFSRRRRITMSQDQTTKQAYEHTAKMDKEAREEAQADSQVNAAALKADNHTGQEGMLPSGGDLVEGTEIKEVFGLLPDWHKDELRRLLVVARGTRLKQGNIYCDLRTPDRGELVAHGVEEVHDELLVPKRAVDYEIWHKLLNKPPQP